MNFKDFRFLNILFSDDTLCRLSCTLVELTKCENRDVVIMASKCLGVLGPINMKTISLPAPPTSIGLQLALQCFEVRKLRVWEFLCMREYMYIDRLPTTTEV
jgi:hypothetical protein